MPNPNGRRAPGASLATAAHPEQQGQSATNEGDLPLDAAIGVDVELESPSETARAQAPELGLSPSNTPEDVPSRIENSGSRLSRDSAGEIVALDGMPISISSEIVFGEPLPPGLSKEARRVVLVSATAATLYVTHFLGSMFAGTYSDSVDSSSILWKALVVLFLELSVALWGYCGALRANVHMAFIFTCGSIATSVVCLIGFARLIMKQWQATCKTEEFEHLRKRCEVLDEGKGGVFLTLVSVICSTSIGCLAFHLGSRLTMRLADDAATRVLDGTPFEMSNESLRAFDIRPQYPIGEEHFRIIAVQPLGSDGEAPLADINGVEAAVHSVNGTLESSIGTTNV